MVPTLPRQSRGLTWKAFLKQFARTEDPAIYLGEMLKIVLQCV